MPSTFRSDVRVALYNYLVAWKAANPSLVTGEVYRVRPGAVVTPGAYIGSLGEPVMTQTAQIWQRNMDPEVVLVHRLIVPGEAADVLDDMVDSFTDYVDGLPHLTAYSVINLQRTRDVEVPFPNAIYSATVVTLRAMIGEGRS